MNFRGIIFLLIIGSILISQIDAQRKKGSKKGKKDPCHLKEIDVCIGKVQALGKRKEPSALIASNEGLNTICKAIKEDLTKCVKNFIKKCGTPLHKEVSDLIVDQIDNSISRFCDPNNPQRQKFLKESPCIHKKVFNTQIYKQTCNNNFLATVDKIDAEEHLEADRTHTTICCGYNKWDECSKKLITKECGNDAVDVYGDFVGEAFGTLTKMICPAKFFASKKNNCKDVLPKDDVIAKGKLGDNALTKYVVSLFSFLFIFDE
ncbi:hypothetical protein DERP_006318 [Dermatophagoides pteronyssinus]|uniref:27 kDa hemolymph protein-like n=1 Tax=Dermatophagoides pteronyssinus TaxID=6956 RepID=A0ABQ8IYF7_DERPT|nr:hypothetical protein DERP_006318 [Dermatophagoides pteronyssinus]